MANYNPHAPQITGNEWVPIRQENYQPDEITERGYRFHIDHGTIIVSGSNSIADVPPALSTNKIMLNAIYPVGLEDETGPIRQVTIPVDGVTVTGAGITAFVNDFITPTDDSSAILGGLSFGEGIGLSFNVAGFTNELNGKRILNVELLYTANGDPSTLAQMRVDIGRAAASGPNAQTFAYQQGLEGAPFEVPTTRISTVQFKDVTTWWNNSVSPTFGTLPLEVFPWRYTELALLDATASPSNAKLQVSIFWTDSVDAVGSLFINYAALRVTYCEENRVLYGARMPGVFEALPGSVMRHRFLNTSFAHAATTLNPGDYVLTSSFRSLSNEVIDAQIGEDTTTPWNLYALRQLYEIPSLPGIQVNTTKTVGDEFSQEPSDVLPQTMMYTAGAIVTGSHAYGGQIQAPSYGAITATQTVNVVAVGSPNTNRFSWVRYYARRFGGMSGFLRLRLTDNSLFADITASDFDALPEIVDGWKEITLKMTPTGFTSGSSALTWVWEAIAASASTQWQILGADGPSLPGVNASGIASYATVGSSGGAVNILTWKGPNQTVATNDSNADATLLFSAAAPAVTGIALSTCTVEVTGIGRDCDHLPGCVPTHILGNSLTWPICNFSDSFSRTSVASWGSMDGGPFGPLSYNLTNGIAADYDVNGGTGKITHTDLNVQRFATADTGSTDFDFYVEHSAPVFTQGTTYSGSALTSRSVGRYTDSSNMYQAGLNFGLDGVMQAFMVRISGGTTTIITPITDVAEYIPNVPWIIRFRGVGSRFSMKVYLVGDPEPEEWFLTTSDTFVTTGTRIGVSSRVNSTNTNPLPITFQYDNLCAIQPWGSDINYEIQRRDEVETDLPGDYMLDTFSRVVVSGWGSADTGEPWSIISGPVADYSVNGSFGQVSQTTLSERIILSSETYQDVEARTTFQTAVAPTGVSTGLFYSVLVRATGTTDFYQAQLVFRSDNTFDFLIRKTVSGVATTLASKSNFSAHAPFIQFNVAFSVMGTQLKAKFWNNLGIEPDWMLTATDNSLTSGRVGYRFDLDVTNPLPVVAYVDNFQAAAAPLNTDDGYKTIARVQPSVGSFCDLEARVGEESQYRIRRIDNLDFPGNWSLPLTSALISPGVSGVGDGNSVLIFTSNQDVDASLAYVMNWEGEPIEQFNFPEAGFQQLRTQYGRDFFIAFRPNERGGEQFSRTILVQAAAITPESLADFKSLRDLAWADLPYVCVRDELGNRWFANVAVPTGRVRQNRTLYLAEVNIIEVTDTPAPFTGS